MRFRGVDRWHAPVLVGLLSVPLLVVAGAPSPAAASGVIEVTTTDDVVNAEDGFLSLHEAVVVANTTQGADTIQLDAGETYVLDRGCGDVPEDDPAELRATDPAGLTIEGQGATVTQAGPYSYLCDLRVIHSIAGPLTLRDVSLSGGSAPASRETMPAGAGPSMRAVP